MGSWREKAILWLVMVGKSGLGKTGVLEGAGLSRLRAWQGANIDRYREQQQLYETQRERWENLSREEKQQSPKPQEPESPRQCYSNLTTTESILELNDLHPEGVSAVSDELAAILDSKGQYKHGLGNDQSILLELFTGHGLINNLCNRRIRHLQDPFWCMVGGIQPELLKKIINRQNIADGFAARVLLVFMREPRYLLHWREIARVEQSITVREREAFDAVFQRLIGKREQETNYPLTEGAEEVIRAYQHQLNLEAREADPYLYSPIRKLRTYILRLALLLHCVGNGGARVEEETARLATIVTDYLKENIGKAFHIVFQSKREEQHSLILEKIRALEGKATRQIVQQRLRRHIPFRESGELLEELVRSGLLEERKDPDSRKCFLRLS